MKFPSIEQALGDFVGIAYILNFSVIAPLFLHGSFLLVEIPVHVILLWDFVRALLAESSKP